MAPPTTDETTTRCPYCQARHASGAAFCLSCGRPLPVPNPHPAFPPAPATAAMPASASPPDPKPDAGAESATADTPAAPASPRMDFTAAAEPPPPYLTQPPFRPGDYPPSWYPDPATLSHRHRLRWAAWLLAAFAIGIGGGMELAWWLGNVDGTLPGLVGSPPAAPVPDLAPPTAPTLSPGELPEDSATAAAASRDPPAAAVDAPPATAETPPETAPVAPQTTPVQPAPRRRAERQKAARTPQTKADQAQPAVPERREGALTPLMIAQCNSMVSILEREQCNQEVCNGKWGKYGCPPDPGDSSGH